MLVECIIIETLDQTIRVILHLQIDNNIHILQTGMFRAVEACYQNLKFVLIDIKIILKNLSLRIYNYKKSIRRLLLWTKPIAIRWIWVTDTST